MVWELLYCFPHSFWDTRQRPQRSVSSSQPSPPLPSRILRVSCPLLACCLLLLWPSRRSPELDSEQELYKSGRAVYSTSSSEGDTVLPGILGWFWHPLCSSRTRCWASWYNSLIPYVLRQAHGSGIPNGITKARMCVHSGIHMCFIRHILCHRSVMELQIPERAVMFFARHKVLAFVMASVYSLTDAWFWHPYVLHQACSLSVLHQ